MWTMANPWQSQYAYGYVPERYVFVGALEDTYLKDVSEKKAQAETLFALAEPAYKAALASHSNYDAAIAAVTSTIAAYQVAHVSAAQVQLLPTALDSANVLDAKSWAKKWDTEIFVPRIAALTSILASLKSAQDPRGGAPLMGPIDPALMTVATTLAFAGGGALIGWFVFHGVRQAIIGGGIGLAAGAATAFLGESAKA